MGKINKLHNKNNEAIYPVSISHAVYMDDGTTTLHEEIVKLNLNNIKYNPETNTLIYYNGSEWITLEDALGGGAGEALTEDLTVAGVTVGNLTPGKVLPSGSTAIDILKEMLVKVVAPTYTAPSVKISSNITSIEVGKSISPTITVTFTKNDGGNATSCVIKDGNNIISEQYTIKLPAFNISGDKTYSATVSYGDGPIKNNNVGKPDPTGQIKAGSKTSSVTIKAYRPYFGFAASDYNAPTAEYIRSKTTSGLNLSTNGTIKVVTQPNSRIVCFAYPATLRECTKIRYEDLNDDNNKTAFTYTTLSIPDANGQNPINYRVYYYISPVEFGLNATFTLTV